MSALTSPLIDEKVTFCISNRWKHMSNGHEACHAYNEIRTFISQCIVNSAFCEFYLDATFFSLCILLGVT